MKSPIQLFAAIAILLATATVAAQVYKWVDKDGKVQYSDQAPPAGATKSEAKKVETSPAAAAVADAPPGKALQDRAKDYEKRQKAAADKSKKDADAQKGADIEEANCQAAKASLRDMESGKPIKRSNDKGESVYMSDEDKQAEAAKARAVVAKSCKD